MENKNKLIKINRYLWLFNYTDDYFLDEIIKSGKKGVLGLIIQIQKLTKKYIGVPKIYRDGGCTTCNTKTSDGDYIIGRNFDYKTSPCIVLWTNPKNSYKSIAVSNLNFLLYGHTINRLEKQKNPKRLMATPYTSMDGINEKGLAIAVLEIKSKSTNQKTNKTPITTIVAIRAILDKCATVDEAIDFLNKYDMKDLLLINYHYHITDKEGNSAIIEYVNNKMNVIRKEKNGKALVSSNFFLSKDGNNKKEMGRLRFEKATKEITKVKNEVEMMDLLSKVTVSYRHKIFHHKVGTLWSAVYNNTKLTLNLCTNDNYKYMYEFSIDKPLQYKKVEINLESNPILEGIGPKYTNNNNFIKLENVTKTYGENEGIVCALNKVNLEIEKGKIIAILGSSGSGKSTLLNVISGIDSPNSGNIFYKNTNIVSFNDKKLTKYRKENVSFIFQSFNLINELTVYENIALTANKTNNENIIEDSLKTVDLLDKKDRYPYQLSGGQQQRVSIARVLAKDTELLLCDEPTGALDYQTGKQILIELEKLNKNYNKTIIIVTHTREIGKMADQIITMKNGTILTNEINNDKIAAEKVEW